MRFLPPDRFVGIWIEHAISDARCSELLAELDRRGFQATGEHYPRDYRDNDRLVFDDAALAASLFDLLRLNLPEELVVDGERWQLCGFNPRFRACRYRDGQAFCIHRDGPHVPAADLRSHLTVQLYLDDAPDREGGRTRFYADARGTETWAALTPKRGAAIVFDHRAWHDGEAVTAGVKHVLRTDAMYRRIGASARARDAHIEAGRPTHVEAGLPSHVEAGLPTHGLAGLPTHGHAGLPTRDVVGRHRGYVWRAIACRDGTLASSGRDGTVRRWGRATSDDARGSGPPTIHELGAESVTALVEDAQGRLWCGTRAGTVAVIDGEHVTHVAEHAGAILAACAAGDRVVLATSRGSLLAYDVPGASSWIVAAHDGWSWAVTPVGTSVASCGEDGRIALTDRTGQTRTLADLGVPLRAIAATGAHHSDRIGSADTLLVGDTRGWLHRIDATGDILASIRAHDGAITSVAIAPDRSWVTGSEDGSVKRWRGGREASSATSSDFITSVALDARNNIICAGYDGAIWIVR